MQKGFHSSEMVESGIMVDCWLCSGVWLGMFLIVEGMAAIKRPLCYSGGPNQ